MQEKQSKIYRGIYAEINTAHFLHNFQEAQRLVGPTVKLLPIIKANAYGHGAAILAGVLQKQGQQLFGIACPEEAILLAEQGIQGNFISLGGPFAADATTLLQYHIAPTIYDVSQVAQLANSLKSTQHNLPIYLKLDSGMTRLGLRNESLNNILTLLQKTPQLQLLGMLTHLACADVYDDGPTAAQYASFAAQVQQVKNYFPNIQQIHLANSAAILSQNVGAYQWARPGIMLYGAYPHPRFNNKANLKPVMQLKTKIISLKEVPAGVAVSYCGTYITKRTSKIAVIAAGYADGYSRAFSNCGEVLIQQKKCPVVGRVCMDHTMIDVTDLPHVKIGDEVLLWGEGLRAEYLAEKINTIAYELFCGVAARVPRLYV